MAVELAERVGPSLAWWLERPFAYALFTYRHLQELDRRRDFTDRMQRIHQAQLMAIAFHEPSKLAAEYTRELAAVAPSINADDLRAFSEQMTRDLEAGKVLD